MNIRPPWADFLRWDLHTWNRADAKKVCVANNLARAFRRHIVRYWHYWHPLGCRAIDLGKPPEGGLIYTTCSSRIRYAVQLGRFPPEKRRAKLKARTKTNKQTITEVTTKNRLATHQDKHWTRHLSQDRKQRKENPNTPKSHSKQPQPFAVRAHRQVRPTSQPGTLPYCPVSRLLPSLANRVFRRQPPPGEMRQTRKNQGRQIKC